jgi:hypothetical protein
VRAREFKIDSLKWLKDRSLDGDELAEPEELANDVIAELEGAMEKLNEIISSLAGDFEPRRPRMVRAPE